MPGGSVDMERLFSGELPEILSMGTMIFDPIWGEKDHVTHSTELLHVVKGNVTLVTGRRRVSAGPGDVLIVPPETPHRDAFDTETGLEVFMVFFRWPATKRYFSMVDNRRLVTMPESEKRDLVRVLERLRTDRRTGSAADRLVARTRLATALMLAWRAAWTGARRRGSEAGGGRRHEQLIARAKAYVAAHLHECISLDDVADALDVSPYHLSHVFSEENDFSLFAYLASLRMERARQLLAAGRLNVSEIARAVGFSDANYFSKAFRRHFGRPPRDFFGLDPRRTPA